MNTSDPAAHRAVDYTQEIDGALAALAAVQPREGLEQRVLARIASAPDLPWYRRLAIIPMGHQRWALAAASAVIVAGGSCHDDISSHSRCGATSGRPITASCTAGSRSRGKRRRQRSSAGNEQDEDAASRSPPLLSRDASTCPAAPRNSRAHAAADNSGPAITESLNTDADG